MESGDAPVIICVPVSTGPSAVSSSSSMKCVVCSVDVWVSPASQEAIRTQGARPYCVACAERQITEQKKTGEKIEMMPLNLAQMVEVAQHVYKKRVVNLTGEGEN